jgi:hypothetical protein
MLRIPAFSDFLANDPVNFGDPSGLLTLPRISGDIGIVYSGLTVVKGKYGLVAQTKWAKTT